MSASSHSAKRRTILTLAVASALGLNRAPSWGLDITVVFNSTANQISPIDGDTDGARLM